MTAVEVRAAGDARCGSCTERLYLTAKIPVPQSRRSRVVHLCPGCDAGLPEAQGLLAYFAEHRQVRPEDMHRVSELVGRWLEALTRPDPQQSSLAADVAAWWSGRG
ncbi:hypothetical protein Cs7R123_20930 [Catellatospora sp. TT07R-123]|uniref:DUF6300 family protein n=1 Tax=Catellatospora sp. TT07R-123 TaxID=2733863 RepID=UPI001B09F97B|nr:DUF6300 family protein [Catellatospora sp. TT07R-123]GHJ44751.1 hypothetical protein Cs7R123_20930 [Catellatospora sp. TT07R-123]